MEALPQKKTKLSLQLLQLQKNKELEGHNILDANFTPSTSKLLSPEELFHEQYTLMGEPEQKEQLPSSFYQMVEWKELLDSSIYLQFIGKDCYLLLDHLQNFLAVSISHSSLDDAYIECLAQEFHAVFSLVEKIIAITQKN